VVSLLTVLLSSATAMAPPAGPSVTNGVPTPSVVTYVGPKAPWYRRRPRGERITNTNGQGLIQLSRWPAEPESPEAIDAKTFADALGRLCPPTYRRAAPLYAGWIREHAQHFGVDPFTVAALTYYRSSCRARFADNGSHGLGAINLLMHAGYLKARVYGYFMRTKTGWVKRSLAMKKHLYYENSLRHAEPNIYFTAGILKVVEAQCPDIDSAFKSVEHRHPVSHFYWGDLVRGTDAEDRILLARRRLLAYYHQSAAPTTSWHGMTIQSPLDGGLRKLTSKMGDDRDRGGRRHMGIDFASDRGEPIYAVADGRVLIAGAQRKVGGTINLPSKKAELIPAGDLAAGGLFVMLLHQKTPRELKSGYMHLDRYVVTGGQHVKRGQLLGYVGRSGVKESGAHLHFELREDGKHIDAAPVLGKSMVIHPMETFRGRMLEAEQRRQRKRRRR
jgi:murein DD-endopeptidase MepM/ murein hydrolase activator NlpD